LGQHVAHGGVLGGVVGGVKGEAHGRGGVGGPVLLQLPLQGLVAGAHRPVLDELVAHDAAADLGGIGHGGGVLALGVGGVAVLVEDVVTALEAPDNQVGDLGVGVGQIQELHGGLGHLGIGGQHPGDGVDAAG